MLKPSTPPTTANGSVIFDTDCCGHYWPKQECASAKRSHYSTATGYTGRATTATVSVVDRPHPYGLAAKSGSRRIHIGSHLDRLYADYVWWLCDQGADALIDDWDSNYIFCNTFRQPLYAALRPESVYAHLRSVKRGLPQLPVAMTPHWFRHTHATALLLAGTPLHVVSRRLGHRSVQTTINTYGHVTEDAELEALANWRDVVAGWEANHHDER